MTRRGEAGRADEGVRSDLRVVVEEAPPSAGGGIAIELRSKVELYYGDAIRAQASAVLAELGIEHARVEIDDRGALPYAIGARVEAAARRAGLVEDTEPRNAGAPSRPATARDQLRRSRLYLPGNEPRYMINAGLHGADAVILDLEDSVHPDQKDAARVLVRNALLEVDFGAGERMVRVNQGSLGLDELEDIVPAGPDLVLLPKVESADQVVAADERIGAIFGRLGWSRELWLMPILESALGVENAFAIAAASTRVAAVTLGLEDLTADLGVPKTVRGDETLYARTRVVNAARAAGVQAIDSVFGDVGDLEGLEAWARTSRGLGFDGMGCVHPRQIEPIHRAFAPSEVEIEKALRIVAAFEQAERAGLGVVSLGAKMIDPPVVQRALKLVERARLMGLVGEDDA